MKLKKNETSRPVNTKGEMELEDWQFLLTVGVKVGYGYELLRMIREENGLQSKSKINREL